MQYHDAFGMAICLASVRLNAAMFQVDAGILQPDTCRDTLEVPRRPAVLSTLVRVLHVSREPAVCKSVPRGSYGKRCDSPPAGLRRPTDCVLPSVCYGADNLRFL